ncbi:MAG TPA: P-loop NTPase fold protein, partial [Gemmatimonadales bacterium]|nr:P-loop NTPase fold protein [Gemmatimonadales bacterium]
MAEAPDLARRLALQLVVAPPPLGSSPQPPRWHAMATLVGPREAVTPWHVVRELSAEMQLLARRIGVTRPTPARVVAWDAAADLALLEMEADLPDAGAAPAGQLPPRGAPWASFLVIPALPDGQSVGGRVGQPTDADGVRHLALVAEGGPDNPTGMSGAPVVSGDALIGIMARARGREWYALPLTPDGLAGLRARREDAAQNANVAQQVTQQATSKGGEPRSFEAHDLLGRLSPSSRTALAHAAAMRGDQDEIHMEHLVAGLFLKRDGPAERLFRRHGIADLAALRAALSEAVEHQLPETFPDRPPDLDDLPRLSGHATAALREAQTVADRNGAAQIQSRHLLYGVLSVSECKVTRALNGRGIRREDIALRDEPAQAAGGTPIVGAASDTAEGPDLLDLEAEVDALSALVAVTDTKTPLSIGLFGDWGSGKSFFMRKMDERIRAFRDHAREEPGSPFCRHIVQLWFNAWHYIDRSLWASLGAEIFEGLAHSLAEEDAKQAGRDMLESARTELMIRRTALAAERDRARTAVEKSAGDLSRKEAEIARIASRGDADVERALGIRAIAREAVEVATGQPEVKASLDAVARELGWATLDQSAGRVETQVRELLEVGSFWKSVMASLGRRADGKGWIGGVVLVAVVLVVTRFLFAQILELEAAVAWLTSALVAVSAAAAPVLTLARRVTALVKEARHRMQRRITERRQAEMAAARAERAAAEEAVRADREGLAVAEKKLAEIDEKLASLAPVRQLTDFIRMRHQSNEYTKHFGVIARARQDFEELTRLMELVKRPADAAASGTQFAPIDRIVLYIDDLDRCPEHKVFDVLQAVHLLLAFPLFVVVVGVDPRWLMHSLRSQLGAFRDQPDQEVEDEEQRVHWHTTPLNYLEKIFQVPFTVRPMDFDGYGNLIDRLTTPEPGAGHGGPSAAAAPPAPPPGPPVGSTPAPVAGPPAPDAAVPPPVAPAPPAGAPAAGGAQVPAGAPVATAPKVTTERARLTHERLQLNGWEREYMKYLFPLIPSPRAAKRFVNVYRLLRAVVTGPERAALVEQGPGGYRPTLMLLAMVTGYPLEGAEVIRELLERRRRKNPPGEWWALVDLLRKEREENGSGAP